MYVMLSAVPSAGYGHGHGSQHGHGGMNNDDGTQRSGTKRSSSSISSDDRETKKLRSEDSSDCATLSSDGNTETEKPVEEDIRKVETSRAVLIIVGKDECGLHVSLPVFYRFFRFGLYQFKLTNSHFFLFQIYDLVARN